MIEGIKKVLELGGTISLSYKSSISSWYGEIKIYKYGKTYTVSPRSIEFYDVDEAVNFFCKEAFSSSNFGYIQGRLGKKGSLKEIDDEYDFENPSEELIKLFEEEGKLADEELELKGISVKPFPTKEEALKELDELLTKYTDANSFKELLTQFKKKYSMLHVFTIISAVYKQESGNEFRTSTDLEDLDRLIKTDKISDDRYTFERYELSFSISNGNHKWYTLNI